MKSLRSHTLSEDGFTLVELMIVVVVIVGLASIAVPIYLRQKEIAINASIATDTISLGNTVGQEMPFDMSMTESDFADVMLSTDGLKWELHLASQITYCVTAWDPSRLSGFASHVNRVYKENEPGTCMKLGISGINADKF